MSHGRPSCGVHSKSDSRRSQLPENPNKEQMMKDNLLHIYNTAIEAGVTNVSNLAFRGKIICRKLGMMKPMPYVPGYFLVLPNVKARSNPTNKQVMWAMSSLSPMVLGPVNHQQPNLPPSENIENFHQFNKVFQSEYNSISKELLPTWYQSRLKGYKDRVPHRHKLGNSKVEHMKKAGISSGGNANACLFSVYVDPYGKERRFSYTESRVFYCTFYERLASQTEAFKKLLGAIYENKQNIVIAGYDARIVNEDDTIDADVVDQWYNDPSMPFGHEMVLFTMLMFWNEPENFPWRKASSSLDFQI
jgi:hypothetical protein